MRFWFSIAFAASLSFGNFMYQHFSKQEWEKAALISFHQTFALIAFVGILKINKL